MPGLIFRRCFRHLADASVVALLLTAGFSAGAPEAVAGPSACSLGPGTAFCFGNQTNGLASGVDFPSSTTFLLVAPFNGQISPPAGTHGIFDLFDTSLSLGSLANITTTGAADAISLQGPGAIVVSSGGALTTARRGIYASSWNDAVTITSKGAIHAGEEGILAQGNGAVSVNSEGNITAAFKGFFANSFSNAVTVVSKGNIDAFLDSIWAQGNGAVSVTSVGSLSSSNIGRGIFANSFSGPVYVSNTGNVSAALDLIWAQGLGNVTVLSQGALTRNNLLAEGRGIFAHSFNGAVGVLNRGDITANLDGIWAEGFTGVAIDSVGNITNPNHSRGIFAQSPTGGVSVKSVGNIDAYLDGIWARGVNAVDVTSAGTINSRNFAHGIYAESLSSTVSVNSNGNINSDLDGIFARGASNASVKSVGNIQPVHPFGDQRGIFAQSLGGSVGVDSKGDITVSLEAIWAKGTESVFVKSEGNLTSSNFSKGIYAESLFKGTTVQSKGNINSYDEAIFARGVDNVAVTNQGDLTTSQLRSLFAQSTNGKVTINTAGNILASSTLNASEGIFASGFSGVEINNWGNVTSNDFRGIFAESSTGPIDIKSWGNISALGTNHANGEAIFADNNGPVSVYTRGNLTSTEFRGVFLQSRSSSLTFDSVGTVHGAFEGLFLSGGTDINATVMGDVTSDSWRGILATRAVSGNSLGTVKLTYGGGTVKSNGGDPNKQTNGIEVDAFGGKSFVTILSDGVVTGGSNNASGNFSYGVFFKLGTNTLTNWGQINEANGGRAIGGIGGDDDIENYGLVKGSVYLGSGANAFNNQAGGVFESGINVDVGVGNAVTNLGTISPGGVGPYLTTNFNGGNLVQKTPGEVSFDIDFDTPAVSDHIVGVGTAQMGGFARADVHDLNLIYGASQTATIVNAATVVNNGITGAAQGAVQVDVSTTATTVDVSVGLNFAAKGLEGNQALMGNYLQGFFMGGVPVGLQTTFLDLAGIPTTTGYGEAIAALGPEGFAALSNASLASNQAFTGNLFSCPTLGNSNGLLGEGECVWGAAQYRTTRGDAGAGTYGYSDSASSVSAGMQWAMEGAWRVGFGLGYENGNYSSGTTTADRNLFNAGIVVKNKFANYDLAVALSGGGEEADATRFIPVPGVSATSQQMLYFASLSGKLSRGIPLARGYIRPSLELGGTWLHRNGFTETGAGPLDLIVAGGNDFIFHASPMLEIGTEMPIVDGIVGHPFARVGMSFYSGADSTITAGFAPFTPTVTLVNSSDSVYADLAAGVDILSDRNWTARFLYQGRFSKGSNSQVAGVKATIKF